MALDPTDLGVKDIRETYNFICANYVDGDDIVLVGFSRGAFTARSIADLIASIGLLNTRGLESLYRIFEDYENMADEHRSKDKFLGDSYGHLEKYNNQKGKERILWENKRKEEYKQWLKKVSGPPRFTNDDWLSDDNERAATLDSRHLQGWLHLDPDQGGCRLGHCRITWDSCHASSWDQWFCC